MANYRETNYVYGNTVRKVEALPSQHNYQPRRQVEEPRRQAERPVVSHRVKNNRKRIKAMDLGYLTFLSVAAAVVVIICVQYLQLQSEASNRSANITSLQQELSDLRMENDAALGAIEDQVNLELIKEKAVGLGMVYMDASQVIEYASPTTDYMKQYENIPESGILVQSETITD